MSCIKNKNFVIRVWMGVVAFLFLSGCFGGGMYNKGSVLSYKQGIVRTHGGRFRIGELPKTWRQTTTDFRAVVFTHKGDASTITVDSWCKSAVDDASLKTLSGQLYRAFDQFRLKRQQKLSLDNREALLTVGHGVVDGVPLYFESYVLKKDACVFDFVYLGSSLKSPAQRDFRHMVKGFHFIKGPFLLRDS